MALVKATSRTGIEINRVDIYKEASRHGVELEEAGQFEAALDAYAEMMKGDEEDQLYSYLQRSELLEKLGRFEECLKLRRLAIELAPDWGLLAVSLYYTLLRSGLFDEAVEEAKLFFKGRWHEPHPEPNVDDHRKDLLELLNMDEEGYNECRQRFLDDPKTGMAHLSSEEYNKLRRKGSQ